MDQFRKRATVVFLLTIAFFGVAFASLFSLQVLNTEKSLLYLTKKSENFYRRGRGTIVDRKGRDLAVSVDLPSVYADPKFIKENVKNSKKMASLLSEVLDEDAETIYRKITSNPDSRFVWIARQVPQEKGRKLKKLIDSGVLKGIRIIQETKRFYPKGTLAANVIGFVGRDNRGLEGLEYYYDDYLTGKITRYEMDKSFGASVLKVAGVFGTDATMQITIDEVLQSICEEELKKGVLEFNARSGMAVMLHPNTGEVLAMAVYPSYDPNHPSKYPAYRRRNRTITDIFEPGSSFKPVVMSALLNDGLVSDSSTFECKGYIDIAGERIRCSGIHGLVTPDDIIRESCNVGQIEASMRMVKGRMYWYIRQFGFGSKSGIDLPGEASGILRPPSKWTPFDRATISIGQGIGVTALQLASAYQVFANEGVLMKPFIVKKVVTSGGDVIFENSPKPVREVIQPSTAYRITRYLVDVVRNGTGVKAAVEGYTVAGKTGTAQKSGKWGYIEGAYVATFAGFAPAFSPRVVLVVVLDEPRPEYLAGETAAVIFSRIMKQALEYLGAATGEAILPRGSVSPPPLPVSPPGVVPDFRGLTMREALELARGRNIHLEFEGCGGVVVSQSVAPGSRYEDNVTVILKMSG